VTIKNLINVSNRLTPKPDGTSQEIGTHPAPCGAFTFAAGMTRRVIPARKQRHDEG
jgi:hypothetical protein